jgi:glycosyltransferase involved in cell wall biosynthesis
MKVTVLMPVYNAAKYLNESIDSILNQTFTDFEFLIINDGSTDDSGNIIDSYSDKRIRHHRLSNNKGLIKALNIGLELAQGEYIVRMDADDISHHDRLMAQVNYLDNNPEVSVASVSRYILGVKEKTLSSKYLSDLEVRTLNIFNCPIVHPGAAIRNAYLKSNNLKYNTDYVHAEDTALWTEILLKSKIVVLNKKLLGYRIHNNQVSSLHSNIQRQNSTKCRVRLFELLTGCKLSESEINLYRSLSYKEANLTLDDFELLPDFVLKLKNGYSNKDEYKIDILLLEKILYKRIRVLYLKHSFLKFKILRSYLKHYFFDFKIFIGISFFFRIIAKPNGF